VKIAQPFMAGYRVNQMKKSREGRQKKRVAVRKLWPCASTFRPWRDFGRWRALSPSHKWLGYFQVQRRDAENGHRDSALPSKVPAGRPMAVCGGRTGQWVFESRHTKRKP
jgi:hypothetical protein